MFRLGVRLFDNVLLSFGAAQRRSIFSAILAIRSGGGGGGDIGSTGVTG
jgi:hypothetical protein